MAVYQFVDRTGRDIRIRNGSDINRARIEAGKHAGGDVYTLTELKQEWEKFFPPTADVAEVIGEARFRIPTDVFKTYPIRGYDLVHEQRGYTPPDETEPDPEFEDQLYRIIIRISERGVVRCPEELFRRVIGKGGEKIRELSKKHGVDIKLIRVANEDLSDKS